MNVAIILAGGIGTRVGANIPKQFIEINGKPILAYTLEIFEENSNIDAIEVVCHKDWIKKVEEIIEVSHFKKIKWIIEGGQTFQDSVKKGVFNLKEKISSEDTVVISFGASPMTPQEDINDSIRVCKKYGNGISSADIELCTCVKENEFSTTKNLIRENIKGFANPWTFNFGELCNVYERAIELGILEKIEPHTTSLYLALGKRLWFSKSTSSLIKITKKSDLEMFEAFLLLKEKRRENDKL